MKGRLVLTRRLWEKIYIGEDRSISIQIVGVWDNATRLAIEADKSIPIIRKELINKLEDGNNGI